MAQDRKRKKRHPLYGSSWERERKAFLSLPGNQTCRCGCGKRADTVDHDPPHRGDHARFWDRSTWKPMAFACHSRKTVRQDGGFGNKPNVKGCDASGRPRDPNHPWNRTAGR